MKSVIINICGYNVLISECDFEKLAAFKWHKNGNARNGGQYFAHKENGKSILLHRFITNCPKDKQVDHINGNTLDNRRENLRICSQTENMWNMKKHKNSESPYKGVWRNRKKWCSSIAVHGKKIHLGTFNTPEEAHGAYCTASENYHQGYGRTAD